MSVNDTAGIILALLRRHGPMHGGDIAIRAAAYQPICRVTRSQVYREVESLHLRGLVRYVGSGTRRSVSYQISRAGTAALNAWLAAPTNAAAREVPLARVALADDGAARDTAVAAAVAHHGQALTAVKAAQSGADPVLAELLDLTAEHHMRVLAWLTRPVTA